MLSASSTPILSGAARRLIAQFVVVAAFAVLFYASPASAMKQSTSENQMMQVEAALFAAVPDAKGPGAVVLIARGENVLSVTAQGVADVAWSIPLAPSQTFAIASVTKIFTAAAVVRLAEEGRLSLDDTLSTYVPEFGDTSGITIRELLSHTAGVSDRAILSEGPAGFLRQDISLADLVTQIATQPSDFKHGRQQRYSNAGYILLGAVLEKVTGKTWDAAIRDLVIAPAGLRETGYAPVSTIIPGRVAGYTNDTADRTLANAEYISLSVPASAGGMVSTAGDLHRWMRALVNGEIVSTENFRLMTTPVIPVEGPSASPYGLGFYVWNIRGEAVIGHTGQINGFTSMLAYLPREDATIVVLANNDGFDAQTFGRRLAAIMTGSPYEVVKPDAVSPEDLEAFAGSYGEAPGARIIVVRDDQLFARRGASREIRMAVSAKGNLHYNPDELTFFTPIRDASGKVVALDYYARGEGPAVRLARTD
ncbi:serine hydrolase domain-containing protein [Brevundimonas diminuta]|jgi:CubicO group peptidase (beta-lactamase class C family)|uniref:serine hydrolase domain-containing protein n=1 Tax=Brevundimonas diminuta TaxID=293 RepID=UPI0035DF80AC